jgi:hypothetical protein
MLNVTDSQGEAKQIVRYHLPPIGWLLLKTPNQRTPSVSDKVERLELFVP